jgi:hypothetical protein
MDSASGTGEKLTAEEMEEQWQIIHADLDNRFKQEEGMVSGVQESETKI